MMTVLSLLLLLRHKYHYEYDIRRHEDDIIEIDCKYKGGILLKCQARIRNLAKAKPLMNSINDRYFPEFLLAKLYFEETCQHVFFADEKVNIFIMDLLLTNKEFSDWR